MAAQMGATQSLNNGNVETVEAEAALEHWQRDTRRIKGATKNKEERRSGEISEQRILGGIGIGEIRCIPGRRLARGGECIVGECEGAPEGLGGSRDMAREREWERGWRATIADKGERNVARRVEGHRQRCDQGSFTGVRHPSPRVATRFRRSSRCRADAHTHTHAGTYDDADADDDADDDDDDDDDDEHILSSLVALSVAAAAATALRPPLLFFFVRPRPTPST
jgi:hypothetical protein